MLRTFISPCNASNAVQTRSTDFETLRGKIAFVSQCGIALSGSQKS